MLRKQLAFVLTALTLGSSGVAGAQSQAWQKLIAPGLTYRMEIDLQKPIVIHALRWTAGSGSVRAKVETAKDNLVAPEETDRLRGRDVLTNAMKRTEAVAGVNGDFFGGDGSPLGCMVRDGEILTLPYPDRACFVWGSGVSGVATLSSRVTASVGNASLTVNALNTVAKSGAVVLDTPPAGFAMASGPATQVIFTSSDSPKPGGTLNGTVTRVETVKSAVQLGKKEFSLTASGASATQVASVKVGDPVTVQIQVDGADFSKVHNVVGGGPTLLHDGRPSMDPVKEQFSDALVNDRHPRTAIGSTKDGDVWLVVVDGREVNSRGASLGELAGIMAGLGCTEAINLNGGATSTLAVYGLVLNRPSDGIEKPISDAVLLFGDQPVEGTDDMAIKGTPSVVIGQPTSFAVIDQHGETVSNGEVLWSCRGAAGWIDQAGTVRAVKPGDVTVFAWVRGKLLSVPVHVVQAE